MVVNYIIFIFAVMGIRKDIEDSTNKYYKPIESFEEFIEIMAIVDKKHRESQPIIPLSAEGYKQLEEAFKNKIEK